MYKSALAGLSLLAILTVTQTTQKASALEITDLKNINFASIEQEVIQPAPAPAEPATAPAVPAEEKPAEVTYTVTENDSLSKIAKHFNTTWKRLYDKNVQIENPDVITVGQVFTIPTADEVLVERALPVVAPVIEAQPAPQTTRVSAPAPKRAAPTTQKAPAAKVASTTQTAARGSSSGNLYVPGNCTWYVKNKRPDLPNNLGNADTWVSRARAQGIPTGTTPRAGAVGQRGMHVVYVESVNADGSVNISEMNHKGLWVVTYRTLPGNYFTYIY